MWIHFGLIRCPWSVKEDSRGRSRFKKSDARFITDRERNGGCCIDFKDNLECARCHCHITYVWDSASLDEIVPKLSIYWNPEDGYGP